MSRSSNLFKQLVSLETEKRNHRSQNIDKSTIGQVLKLINEEDRKVFSAVRKEIPYILKAVKLVLESFHSDGRLIYLGAGTSGRLGVLDAAECPPTYGTDPLMVQAVIAGGKKAVFRSQEGVEDKTQEAIRDLKKLRVTEKDIVCGIAASVRTPYVQAGIREAKKRKAKTILITTNPRSILQKREFSSLQKNVDVAICPVVGPEVVMGSTRMKSGTAQKLVLNMITTTAMIKLGKVYENMMVDLKMNSKKLEERAKRVLMIVTGVDYATATQTLKKANGQVKTAIVMLKTGVSVAVAQKRLKNAKGFVRSTIEKAK